MGRFSRRGKYWLAVGFIVTLTLAGPLACTSPIPAQITLRTKPNDTATPLPTPTEPEPTVSPTVPPTLKPPTVPPPTATRVLTGTPVLTTSEVISPTQAAPDRPTDILPETLPPSLTPPAQPSPTSTARAPEQSPTWTPIAMVASGAKLNGAIHYDAAHGFAIVLPEGWTASVSATQDTTYMANSEAVWKADPPPAPLVVVITGPLDTLFDGAVANARTASDVLMVAAGTLGKIWDVSVSTPDQMTVNDYPAATGIVEDNKPERRPQLKGRCVSVLLRGRAAVVWTIGPQAEWQAFAPTFDGMLNSVTFPEPVPQSAKADATRAASAAAPATAPAAPKAPSAKPASRPAAVPHQFPAATDLYVNGTEHYSLLAPAGWRVLEEGGMFTIASSVDDFSLPVPGGPVVEVMTGSLSQLYDGAAKGATDANGLLQVAIQVQAERGINVVGGPRPFAVDGRNGLIVDVAGGGMRGQMLAVYLGAPDRANLMGVLAPEDQWSDFAATFQTMGASLKFDVK